VTRRMASNFKTAREEEHVLRSRPSDILPSERVMALDRHVSRCRDKALHFSVPPCLRGEKLRLAVKLPVPLGCHRARRSEAALPETSICHTVATFFTRTGEATGRNRGICSNLIAVVGYKGTLKSPRNCNCTTDTLLPPSQLRISRLLSQGFSAFAVIPIFGGLLN
jgi:hypothetical protein